jgi:hypothetical protein
MAHSADKAVWRQSFGECVYLKERAVDFLWVGREDAMQAYGAGLLFILT